MAGIFSFFNPSKPGLGIDKNQKEKKPFFVWIEIFKRKFFKLIQLNFIFLLFCIPIITIGPAISGLMYVLKNISTEKPVFIFHDFLKTFKKNFVTSLIISIIKSIIIILFYFSITFYSQNVKNSIILFVPLFILLIFSIIYLFMNYYLYSLNITIELSIKNIFKNSFLLAFIAMKTNFIISIFVISISYVLFIFYPISLLIILSIAPSTIAFIICFNSLRVIKKYLIKTTSNNNDETEDKIFKDIGSKEIQYYKNRRIKK